MRGTTRYGFHWIAAAGLWTAAASVALMAGHHHQSWALLWVAIALWLSGLGGILAAALLARRHARELAESEERYRLLLEHSGEAIFLTGPDGTVYRANPAACRMLGRTEEEICRLGRDCTVDPSDPRLPEALAVRERSGSFRGELRFRRKDGAVFPAEVTSEVYHDSAGEARASVIVRDLTERIATEERMRQAEKMESVGRLAGGVAHEFNNLLTVINGYSLMLLDGLERESPLHHGLEEIHKAGERAAGLTRQLLAFSRKQVLQPSALNIDRIVGDLHPMLLPLVGETVDVRLVLNAPRAVVRADRHQLEQALLNLVVNAGNAMPQGGKLTIETDEITWDAEQLGPPPDVRVERYLRLTVSDTGAGMDQATRRRIFDPFFTTKGGGLGLSTVQSTVAQSGGVVEVRSQPGSGTTFKLCFPLLEGEVGPDLRSSGRTPVLTGAETILVVEDQPEVLEYAAGALRAYGYSVLTAEGAAQAVAESERQAGRIDLLLTDVVMPGLSGPELAVRIKRLRPGIGVLFMSGYPDDVVMHHGVLQEGVELIQKPFGPEQLAARVRQVLGPPQPQPRT